MLEYSFDHVRVVLDTKLVWDRRCARHTRMPPSPASPFGGLFPRLANWEALPDFEKMLADCLNGMRSPAEIANYRPSLRRQNIRGEMRHAPYHIQSSNSLKRSYDISL